MPIVVELIDQRAVRIISDPCEVLKAHAQGLDLVCVKSCDLDAQTIEGVAITAIYRRNADRAARVANRRLTNPEMSESEIYALEKLDESIR